MTVDRLMREMTSEELVHWMAYSELEREEMEGRRDKAEVENQVKRSGRRR
jgi:hypothetical protein